MMVTGKDLDDAIKQTPYLAEWVEQVKEFEQKYGVVYSNVVQCVATAFISIQIMKTEVANEALAEACEEDVAHAMHIMCEITFTKDGTWDKVRDHLFEDMQTLVRIVQRQGKPAPTLN
jgi:hypothetical protein